MKFAEHIIDLVGHTPLVRLNSVTQGLSATVLVKVEYLNPGGSAKDRIALAMVEEAERTGALKPGGTIVEPTSGNTGVGLALVAQRKGYKCVFVCPDKVSEDNRNALKAYGAEVVVTPTAVAPEDPRSYYNVSDRLAAETPGGWKPDQYSNQQGPAAHYATTGPEVWADTAGKVTHFVAGVGTGGTITGTGCYLQEVSADRASGRVQIIGADPVNSVYSGGTGRPYLVEGVGEDFWPSVYDPAVPDEIIAVTDSESFDVTRRLAREEGLLVGGSCGMAVEAGLKLARRLENEDPAAPPEAVIVCILPDGGRGYLSKIFDDHWMDSHGFPTAINNTIKDDASHPEPPTLGAVLGTTGRAPSQIEHLPNDATLQEAVDIFARTQASVLPVVGAQPPLMIGEVAGALTQVELLQILARNPDAGGEPISEHLGAPLPLVGVHEPVTVGQEKVAERGAVMVLELGRPIGVLGPLELVNFSR